MASGVEGLPISDTRSAFSVTCTATQRFSNVTESASPLSGCLPTVSAHTPDILATTSHSPATHSDPEPGHGAPVSVPHHYQSAAAPPYSRGALPVGVGDQMLAPNMLPAMYPPLPGHHPHPGIPVAGRNPLTPDLPIPGYHHIHSTDPNLGISRHGMGGDALPDIVHSHSVGHAPPPRPNQHRSGTSAAAAASRHQRQRQQQNRGHGRTRGGTSGTGRSGQRRRRSRTHSSTSTTPTGSGVCKEPCVKCMVTVTSLRWVLLVLSMLGVLFVVSGIVMAALHAVGNDFLVYALVFIGLGVVLVAVVVVAWKCTPPGSEPIHALFNIGDSRSSSRSQHRPRRTHRSRDGQWHGGLMYPEFQYRRPPPTYAASMQAYQAQLLDAQSNNNTVTHVNNNSDDYSLPGSPPPSYRSRASTIHSGVHITFPPGHDSAPNSRPPTYRSRANSHQRPRLPMDELETSSPSSAPADVSFTGPMMTAEAVQQIIGTNRNHCRQQSAGAVVWHTRSSSLDFAQNSNVTRHRRGASLDNSSAGVMHILNSQENQAASGQSRAKVMNSEPAPENSHGAVPETASSQAVLLEGAQRIGSDTGQNDHANTVDNTVTLTIGDEDSEPEQYNTPL